MFYCRCNGKVISKTYNELWRAKNWLRKHINIKNKKLPKPCRYHYEDFEIVESQEVKVHYL